MFQPISVFYKILFYYFNSVFLYHEQVMVLFKPFSEFYGLVNVFYDLICLICELKSVHFNK